MKDRKGGKKLKRKCLAVLMLVWLCIENFSLTLSVSGENSEEYRETIEASVFFGIYPGELRLVKNINLIFENMDLPINTSIIAFNDGFLELKCSLETKAANGLFIKFDVYFEQTVGNKTANLYAEEITGEIMKAFNYSQVNLSWKDEGIRDGKIWVYRSFRIPISKENILIFLKRFVPKNGFAKFIDGIVEKYFPGDATTGLSPDYFIEKVNSKFYLHLVITGMCSDLLPSWEPRNYQYSLSLKELLNTNSWIVDQPHEYQQIIIRYEKNHTEQLSKGWTTYTIDVNGVQPEGYTIAQDPWPNWKDIKYKPLFPMENVIANLKIDSYVQRQTSPSAWPILATIVLLIVFLLLLYVVKKHKRR
jgi:hypothetical protein